MYRANFYGQSGYNPFFALGMREEQSLGLEYRQPLLKLNAPSYGFAQKALYGFEERLKLKLSELRKEENELREKIALHKGKPSNKNLALELTTYYSYLQSSKKLLALMVEQMQKCLQTIAANFH